MQKTATLEKSKTFIEKNEFSFGHIYGILDMLNKVHSPIQERNLTLKNRIRILAAALAGLALVSLTACGNKAISTTPSAATAKTDTADAVTITFWDDNGGREHAEYYEKLIADFEAGNPDIHIAYTGISGADALARYQTAIALGETPDVGGLSSGWASAILQMNHCVPLDAYMAGWEEAADIAPDALIAAHAYSADNTLSMLPYTESFNCLWVNTRRLAAAGLTVPTTWEEFFRTAQALTDAENGQFGFTLQGGAGSPDALFNLIFSYLGTTEVFDENGRCTIDNEQAIAFVDSFLHMYGRYTPESDITATYKETCANFDKEVCAMLIHDLSSYNRHLSAFGEAADFEAVPLPKADNGTYINLGGSISGLAMFDTCENKDAAWRWIAYLCGYDGNSRLNQAIGQLPTNTRAYADAWVQEQQPVRMALEQRQDSHTVTYYAPTYLPEWGTINATYIEPAIQSAMQGDTNAEELLKLWSYYLTRAYTSYQNSHS